ncbi:MAG TPA: hypothetical protein HA257_05270 [Candidatus Methanoperedenaceae archaeon]|nr:hypothetical protein [Candidatus Methanoperedenaceae archaeon]
MEKWVRAMLLNSGVQSGDLMMPHSFALEIFISIKWGSGHDEMLPVLENFPLFGEISAGQMRKVRAQVRIRLDAWDNVHALADAQLPDPDGGEIFIYHFNSKGSLYGKTLLPFNSHEIENLTILDYTVDSEESCYLLEQMQSGEPIIRLRKINKNGDLIWCRTDFTQRDKKISRKLDSNFERLLMDEHYRLFLPATQDTGEIIQIDPVDGTLLNLCKSERSSSNVFLDARGNLVYVLYFPELNRRGFGIFNIAEHKLKTVVAGDELYGWLIYPFGVDSSSNIYVWNENAIARISFGGQVQVMASIDNIVVRSNDGMILSSQIVSIDEKILAVQVKEHSISGVLNRAELRLPEKLNPEKSGTWKLIHFDERDRYYVFGGEEPGHTGTLLVYSREGDLEETISPPEDLLPIESTLESHSKWGVDSKGRVYMPVINAQGFKVLRLIRI